MEMFKLPACTVGWVAQLCRSWLSLGKATWISHGRNFIGTIQLQNAKMQPQKIQLSVCLLSVFRHVLALSSLTSKRVQSSTRCIVCYMCISMSVLCLSASVFRHMSALCPFWPLSCAIIKGILTGSSVYFHISYLSVCRRVSPLCHFWPQSVCNHQPGTSYYVLTVYFHTS